MARAKKSKKAAEHADALVDLSSEALLEHVSGARHENLKRLADIFDCRIGGRGRTLHLVGNSKGVQAATRLFHQLNKIGKNREFSPRDLELAAESLMRDPEADLFHFFSETVFRPKAGRQVAPKGAGQRSYVEAIRQTDLVFGVGPAGTGKTYLAVALAVADLLSEKVSRIVLTRPAVEAGERLGFLPGNMEEKVLPYLRPLYDAMYDMMSREQVEDMVARGVIEVAPLAFMRGRTLSDAFVILDEAQNTTREQMKMFLTRLGFGSKMVVTGDVTQIDLPRNVDSGLLHALSVLEKVEGVSVVEFTELDVVRHPLVRSMIHAYAKADKKGAA